MCILYVYDYMFKTGYLGQSFWDCTLLKYFKFPRCLFIALKTEHKRYNHKDENTHDKDNPSKKLKTFSL